MSRISATAGATLSAQRTTACTTLPALEREVGNLADFLTGSGLLAQIGPALQSGFERRGHGDVGRLALVQGLAWVAGLTAGFATAVIGALRFGAFEAVSKGGLLLLELFYRDVFRVR